MSEKEKNKYSEDKEKNEPTAIALAKKQRDISVAEFFEKNRHLLGFDNKRKALLTAVREAVDNALDACEEARILPEINIQIIDLSERFEKSIENKKLAEGQTTLVTEEENIEKEAEEQKKGNRYRVIVEDNGPGIVKKQIPNIFAKLLYGSKFHSLKQSLTEDEPILIKQDGKIQIKKIGCLIDEYVSREGDFECSKLNIEVPCFDWSSYKYSFKPVSHFIKHKRENEIYDIATMYGKHIKVTGCHSVFTINKKSLKVEEVQARDLNNGDILLAPKKLDILESKNEINILDYIDEDYAKKHYWYLYADKEIIIKLFSEAKTVHFKKQGDKSRKYYRFVNNSKTADILDDSYKQYITKGFVPVWLIKFLNAKIDEGIIKTYNHGKEYNIPVMWSLTSGLMKLIGLFCAEGHTDNRQVGFTFSREERELVKLVCDEAFNLGASYTVEERAEKNSVRVKVFGGVISHLFRKWFGHKAKNKKLPDFVFTSSKELRQDCLDYLYVGDGHNTLSRNQLMLSTVSGELANQVIYLWLMQGVVAGSTTRMVKGFGKEPSKCYVISVYGKSIDESSYFQSNIKVKRRRCDVNQKILFKILGNTQSKEVLNYVNILKELSPDKKYSKSELGSLFDTNKIGYKLRAMLDNEHIAETGSGCYCITQKTQLLCSDIDKLNKLLNSDFAFLPVKNIQRLNKGYDYVYDLSVPGNENFIGGYGAIACHNSRGQQGIGISAAALYGQLTTGKPIIITSKISPTHPAHYYELKINTRDNQPEIIAEKEVNMKSEHGTKVEIELDGMYQKGGQSVDSYLKQTAISNPHVTIIYTNPNAEQVIYPRAVDILPKEPQEIKPHPYGVELGRLMKMLHDTESRTLQSFLTNEFSRVGNETAKEICANGGLLPNIKPEKVSREMAEKLERGIQKTKLMAPPTNCLSPIGAEELERGLKKEIRAEFYAAVTRPPAVYRGNPFIIEAGVAYGGEQDVEGLITLLRYANRVPLLYQQGACSVFRAAMQTKWKAYGLSQSKGSLPTGPATVVVHMASAWVPFTSESKEAIANYAEIEKEVKLALQECGRKLAQYVKKKRHILAEGQKRNYIETYIPYLAEALKELLKFSNNDEEKVKKYLKELLEKQRGKLDEIKIESDEFDKSLALETEEENDKENQE